MAIVPPQENPLLSVTSAERATKILADIRTEVRSWDMSLRFPTSPLQNVF